MKYSELVDAYEKIEATTKRLEMTDHLVALFQKTPPDIIGRVVYLTQGKLYPDYVGIETGLAEKLTIRALSDATRIPIPVLEAEVDKTGDLGLAAENALAKREQATLFDFSPAAKTGELSVESVYDTLARAARMSGSGSQEAKLRLLLGILKDATPREARYVVRTVTGNLRLGIADMTIVDALAVGFCGGKEHRDIVERAYNLSSDLGTIAETVVKRGLSGVETFEIQVGKPVRPMLAERLSTPQEVLEKLGGECIAEYKYDGERVQAHKDDDEVLLFSRRLENIGHQYPDAMSLIRDNIKAKRAIVEAEIVAVDPDTGEMRPFQELMHRRRKHGIKEMMEAYPVALYFFDALYASGKDLTLTPYPKRRAVLQRTVRITERTQIPDYLHAKDAESLESFFEKAVEDGSEGLICKAVGREAIYQAGARGWLWIKLKRDYSSELTDTLDLVVVGAFHGRGKRAGSYGALLLASYNEETDTFNTITKVGTGFTDQDLARLPKLLEPYVVSHRHARVNSKMEPNIWLTPGVVMEIAAAEITLSPLHTCAMDSIRKGSGLALRFPRFTSRWRDDKTPEQATTDAEVAEMYKAQKKTIKEEPAATS